MLSTYNINVFIYELSIK